MANINIYACKLSIFENTIGPAMVLESLDLALDVQYQMLYSFPSGLNSYVCVVSPFQT